MIGLEGPFRRGVQGATSLQDRLIRIVFAVGRQEHPWLAGVFLFALAIRLIGIDWRLPNQNLPHGQFEPDEQAVLYSTLVLGQGTYFAQILLNYPLFYYLSFFVYLLYYLLGLKTEQFSSLADFYAQYNVDISPFLLPGRYFVAVVAALTVVMTYLVGKRLFGRKAGFFAMLFMTFSVGHIAYSNVFRLDGLLPLVFLLAFYLIVRLLEAPEERLRPYVFAGLALAAAGTTKVTGWTVLAPALLLPFVVRRGNFVISWRGFRLDRRLVFALFIMVCVHIALVAPALQQTVTIVQHVGATLTEPGNDAGLLPTAGEVTTSSAFMPMIYGHSAWWHLTEILPQQMGSLIYLLALLGIGLLFFDRARRGVAVLLIGLLLAYFIPVGYAARTVWRDTLPMLPFLAIIAGYSLVRVLTISQRKLKIVERPLFRFAIATLLLVGALFSPLLEIYGNYRLRSFPDTRDIAADWIEANVPAGSRLLVESYGPGILPQGYLQSGGVQEPAGNAPQMDEGGRRPSYDIHNLYPDLHHGPRLLDPDALLPYLQKNGIEYVVVSSAYYLQFYARTINYQHPEQAQVGRQFHDLIAGNMELVARFVPDRRQRPGPVIQVFKVPSAIGEDWRVNEGSFVPFPELNHSVSAVGYYYFFAMD